MWYGNTKSLLESIVRWLSAEAPQSYADWQAQTDLVQGCMAEMVEMSEPAGRPQYTAVSYSMVTRPSSSNRPNKFAEGGNHGLVVRVPGEVR